MNSSRRDLLGSLGFLGGLSALGACPNDLLAAQSSDQEREANPQGQANYDFWSQDIRNAEYQSSRGISPGSAPRAVCVYFDKSRGFVTGSDIGDAGLPDRGDLTVLINVDHIRPSTSDQARFANLQGGSLRIDLQQGVPLPSLAERLAWTAIAGILPENKKLPPVKEMTFDPGSTWGKLQSVPLPGGGGRWTWNFFLQHRKSRWMQLFDVIKTNQGLALQILGIGLPAIAITALTAVDKIVAGLTQDATTEWLFQSSDMYFYATKEARDSFEGSKLRLKQGMYVIVASDHLSSFVKQQAGLVVKDGLIVPEKTSSLEVYDAAAQTIPDVTYITVGVTAKLHQPAHSSAVS